MQKLETIISMPVKFPSTDTFERVKKQTAQNLCFALFIKTISSLSSLKITPVPVILNAVFLATDHLRNKRVYWQRAAN